MTFAQITFAFLILESVTQVCSALGMHLSWVFKHPSMNEVSVGHKEEPKLTDPLVI